METNTERGEGANMNNNYAVYGAINAVQAELVKEGISKDRRNVQQNFQFRSIDDCFNALSPLLAKHKLCVLPNILSRECVERQTRSGTSMFYVVLDVKFDFVSAEDGSKHEVKVFGEASDMGDKATAKAASMAYKTAVLQAFAIPTEGDNDPDATTSESVITIQPPTPIVPTTIKTDTEIHERLRKVLAAYCGDDENAKKELLVKITAYTKDGAFHAGEDSVDKLNDHLAAYAIRKFEEMNTPKKEPVTKQQLLDWLAADTSECLKPKHYVIENLEQITSQADKKEIMSALVKRRRELSAKK
jgi:hypothetical protein